MSGLKKSDKKRATHSMAKPAPRLLLAAYFFLAAGIWLVYWRTARFQFVTFDDPAYVTGNKHVLGGLTIENLKWVWTASVASNWHPLTLISHIIDCQIYGGWAGGHHLTSVFFHTLNTWLLFYLLVRGTGKPGPGFFVAALFGWHPLHVESVAWVAERKDVLSTFFGLLSILAYMGYAGRAPVDGRTRGKSAAYYAASVLFFLCGLLAKPMLVTLPFLLLLLDYWLLRRAGQTAGSQLKGISWLKLSLEKTPFFLLSAASCLVTLWAQKSGGAMVPVESLPVADRIANAVFSYYWYAEKLLWPTRLAVYYPYIAPPKDWRFWLALTGLIGITLAFIVARKFPGFIIGWLWFLGTLVPVIGLVQVGGQGMADRYAYIPSIGFFIMVVFGLFELLRQSRPALFCLAGIGTLILTALLAAAERQVACWADSEALYRRAIAVTDNNYAACNNLAIVLQTQGKFAQAADYFKQAVEIFPRYIDAHCNLGDTYDQLKQPAEALSQYQIAVQINPGYFRAQYSLANLLLKEGDFAGAETHYRACVAADPERAEGHYQLAAVLMSEGKVAESCQEYRRALQISPDWVEALNNLAWSLATQKEARYRNGGEAVELALRAVSLTKTNNPGVLDTLGVAYAESGQFRKALDTVSQALPLIHSPEFQNELKTRLALYQNSQPYREKNEPPAVPPAGGSRDN
jgi:tetratricopeptide (TPR) repeat protein